MEPIKTRLTLNLKRRYSFFMADQNGQDLAVCNNFTSKVLDIPLGNSLSEIKVSFASKNPKGKNWKKIERTGHNHVVFKGDSFPLCLQEAIFLNKMDVEDFFWLKIEVL